MKKSILAGLAVLVLTVGAARSQTCAPIPEGLVAWWRAETNAADATGINAGILSNSVSFTSGKVGGGFTFGPNGHVYVPPSELLANQRFTLEAWARPDGPGPINDSFGNTLIIKSMAAGCNSSILINWRATDNRFLTILENTTNIVHSSNSFAPGQFYHVAASYDGATLRLYVNGALEGELPLVMTLAYDPTEGWIIGNTAKCSRDQGFERRWMGVIDEVSIFNRALASNEVAAIYAADVSSKCTDKPAFPMPSDLPAGNVGTPYALTFVAGVTPGPHTFSLVSGALPLGLEFTNGLIFGTPVTVTTSSLTILTTSSLGQTNSRTFTLRVECLAPSGLVSWWRAQGDGLDAVGTNHGTLSNSVSFTAGKVDSGFTFGANGHVYVPDSASLANQQFTIETWARPDGPGPVNDAFGNILIYKPSSINILWRATDDRFLFVFGDAAAEKIISTNVFPRGRFHHVAASYDGAVFRLHVNGLVEGQVALVKTITYDPGAGWNIGNCSKSCRDAGFERRWMGVIDELSVYNRALSSSEVSDIYAAGAAGKCGLLHVASVSPLPGAGEGAAYSQPLVATGGTAPYNFVLLSGALPTGLNLSVDGALSGTPTTPGVSDFTVRVTDAETRAADRHFLLTVNARPVLSVIPSQSVNELATLTVTNIATDADPLDTLTYALIDSPINASISANGVITWTPTEAQGPVATNITTVVTDNGDPNLSRTNTITVVVNELNVAPVLTLPPNTNMNELVLYTAQATATDADLPGNELTFALVSGPEGLTVSSTGAISWTPSEAQGPGSHIVVIAVTDDGTPSLSSTNSVVVVVNEMNLAPVLDGLSNHTVNPGQTVSFMATATDADLPANTLSYSLVSPLAGADISSSGLFTWRPTMAQAGSTNSIQVRVQDNGAPVSNDVKSFTVIVNPLTPVALTPVGHENGQFRFQVSGTQGPDYVIMASTNLTQWTDVATNLAPATPFQFQDSAASSFPHRTYRVRLAP